MYTAFDSVDTFGVVGVQMRLADTCSRYDPSHGDYTPSLSLINLRLIGIEYGKPPGKITTVAVSREFSGHLPRQIISQPPHQDPILP